MIPVSSLGEVSDTRKKILQNTLEDELKEHFMLISQERFEEAQEKAFEELDYEECTEDQCIMMIQEMLQVENVFHLEVIGEGSDTQLSLSWRTLDEKKKETDFCEECKTRELNEKIDGLVNKLVGVKKQIVVKKIPSKKDEPIEIENQKVFPMEVQRTEEGKTRGMFVTVGNQGTLLTSTNGTLWNQRTIWTRKIQGTSSNPVPIKSLFAVTYGKGIFVTVGSFGSIFTSKNGINWKTRKLRYSKSFFGVTYGNGIFVAVGSDGIIYTSTNGNTWGTRKSGTKDDLKGITFDKGLFITVGSGGTILTSKEGIYWTQRNSGTLMNLEEVTYGNGIFVTVGEKRTILTSSNGISWIEKNSESTQHYSGITFAKGLFVIVGSSGTIVTSHDGISWKTQESLDESISLKQVTYGNGVFVTVGSDGTIYTSSNGVTWTKINSGTLNRLFAVTYSK